jgi:ferredoxin
VDVVMRVVVDRDLCEGNARCAQVAPRVFRVNDQDKLELLVEEPDEALRDAVENAVALCPRQALKLVEG